MSYWLWDTSLSVGIDVIDAQHRRIIDYLNELEVAKESADRDTVSEVLAGLIDYTRTHFLFEEELMTQAGYTLSDEHKATHDAFTAQMINYVRQHESGRDVTRKLMSDLRIWLTNHIKRDDKDYARSVSKIINKGWVRKTRDSFFG
ncbi:MAG: bacteriohemerythrin [Chromatiaceae bacterium]|jgi:hemerythrin|nr:bacteriohemerythrin [Chromatiaceae bacterium]